MYDKHDEIKEEAYGFLNKLAGQGMSPALINELVKIRNDMNTRYKGEYHVEFAPMVEITDRFIVNVKVHTVH